MIYQLEKAMEKNLDLLIEYKQNSILEYARKLPQEEITKIKNYINNETPKQLKNYKIITLNNKTIGCILVENHLDGVILEEIFIEKEYRNKGIGTKIIRDILSNHNIVYLWVYKNNIHAHRLYEKLGFHMVEETKTRYFMKYSKIDHARNFCQEVKNLAEKYNLPFFLVTDGASATRNDNCEAVKNARDNHKKWELSHGFDPEEDWREQSLSNKNK